jgi:hypothetical protein
MASESAASLPQFRLSTVISGSFSVLGRNLPTFFVVTILCVIPVVIVGAAIAALVTMTFSPLADSSGGAAVAFVILIVFALVFTYLLIQSAISFGTFQAVRGEKARIGACVARAFAVFPRVFGATIVIVVVMGLIGFVFMFLAKIFLGGMFLGGTSIGQPSFNQGIGGVVGAAAMVLLALVPIIFLTIAWWVVVPAIVVEHAGPIGALGRSYRLVSGHRWGVFGLLVLLFVANAAITQVFQIGLGVASSSMVAISILFILNILVSIFFMALSAVMAAVGYYHLRAEKEGFGAGDLASIFD